MSGQLKEKVPEKSLYQSVINNVCRLEANFIKSQHRLIKEKLATCDEKISRIQKGTSSEYLKELKKISKLRETAFQTACINYKYKIGLVESIYQHEVEQAEKEFQSEVQSIRSNLLIEIEDKIHKLKEDRENVDVTNDYQCEPSTRSHPSTRRNRKRGDQDLPKSKRKQTYGPTSALPLKEEERAEDIKLMKGI